MKTYQAFWRGVLTAVLIGLLGWAISNEPDPNLPAHVVVFEMIGALAATWIVGALIFSVYFPSGPEIAEPNHDH